MPLCPECGYEYKEGVRECPDCHRALVKDLKQEAPRDNIELVPLHSLPGIVYAEMVKEALEKAGIKSVIKTDDLTAGLLAKGAGAAGDNCQILVDKRDKKRAEAILHSMLNHI